MLDTDRVVREVNGLMEQRELWDNKKIYDTLSIEEFTTKMETKYEYIFKNAPSLFKKCIDKDMQMDKFLEMIQYMRQIERGRSENDVHKEVGQLFADRYVNPLVEKLKKDEGKK